MSRPKRDPYSEVGDRTRWAIEQASRAGLTPTQQSALLAIIHCATTWSYHGINVWLGQIADLTFGVTEAEAWQMEKTRKALVALRDHGIIETEPPRGRPRNPAYYIGLPARPSSGPCSEPPAQPSSGLHGTHPAQPASRLGKGASTARQQAVRSPARSGAQHSPLSDLAQPVAAPSTARSRRLAQPATGGPYEDGSEVHRGTIRGARGGAASSAGSAGAPPDDHGDPELGEVGKAPELDRDQWEALVPQLTPAQLSEVLDIIPDDLDIFLPDGTVHPRAANALWIIDQAHDLDLRWSAT